MKLMRKLLAGRQGYTIDQTILIVAIIAILITLIIVTIGWQLINRSSGTKLGSQLRQIEDANGQFFSSQHMWPHQAVTTESAVNDALALANSGTFATTVNTAEMRNLVPGFAISGGNLRHNYGNGGNITQRPATITAWGATGTNLYMVVQMDNMPFSEAQEADRAIDGALSASTGRVVYGSTTCMPAAMGGAASVPTVATSGNVFLCYAANTVQ